jgi:thiopeptide-type bacteriocin biosynthesis protein
MRSRGRADAEHAGFFVLRTPLLPFEELVAFGEGLRAARVRDKGRVSEALAHDRALLAERVRALAARPEIREAVFVASPSLAESLSEASVEPGGRRRANVDAPFVRYFARMCGRCTPFGLFAGTSFATLPEPSSAGVDIDVCLEPRARYARKTRLDMDYLFALTDKLGADRALRAELSYVPNSSLYEASGQLRYVAVAVSQTKEDGSTRSRAYRLVGLEPTTYLRATLERARRGALPAELAAALVSDEITLDEALVYVHELIDEQVLVSNLTPNVTGSEPIHGLVATLAATKAGAASAAQLTATRAALEELDRHGLGSPSSAYRAVASGLESLPAPVELARLFQVDMTKPVTTARLPEAVMNEALRAVTIFRRIAGPPRDGALERFREELVRRHEQRWVRLVDALDETGVRFDASPRPPPILDGLGLRAPPSDAGSRSPKERVLLAKLQAAASARARAIELSDADVDALAAETPAPLPDTFSVMATLLAGKGDFELAVRGVNFAPASALLGRFCHGDEALARAVCAYHAVEESFDPDAVYAEIVHLPEGRVGNVLLRPRLRTHEIVYLGRSEAPREQQIPIEDLWVCVEGDRVLLRSERLRRRIVPRLTTAHNFSRGLPMYRFLCALQGQRTSFLGFSWLGIQVPYFPRVTAGRLILSRARWTIEEAIVKHLDGAKDATERWSLVQDLRVARELPRFVAIEDGDNELVVDLDNVLSVESFTTKLAHRTELTLVEPLVDDLSVTGAEGRYCSELILPFVRTREEPPAARTVSRAPVAPTRTRSFMPGSEWLYVKLYSGESTVNRLLRDVLAPWVRQALASGAADQWFFLRYGDPNFHLRIRLHGPADRLASEVLPALERAVRPALAGQGMWKLELGTYEREIERYGGDDGILLAEELFHHDSELVLQLLELASEEDLDDIGWQLALRGMSRLVDDFGFDLAAKRRIFTRLREGYYREHGIKRPHPPLGDGFRKHRPRLQELVAPSLAPGDDFTEAEPLFQQRSIAHRGIVARLREAERSGRLSVPIEELVPSYLHMHANRVLRTAARAQETVLYDFLDRLYESEEARATRRR